MAMKDLGKKRKNFYDSPVDVEQKKETIVYPDTSLPLEFIEGKNLKVDDNVTLTFSGRVSGMEDTKWSKRVTFELHKGDVDKKEKEGKSLLDG